MLRILSATLLVFLVGCSATTVTRVAEDNRSLYPHGRIHVGWSEYRLLFPLMIHADAALPPVGQSIPAKKAFKDISILNCRSDDTEYPAGGKDAWLRDMKGSLRLISEDRVMIDAYFLDSTGERRSYPFTGKHKIVPSE
ncbi:MAG: hypothetical protein H7A49_05820 [Akkermansiaceae bacterium]|nr:hypothetical protein [Akkermansiaceae bacterium]